MFLFTLQQYAFSACRLCINAAVVAAGMLPRDDYASYFDTCNVTTEQQLQNTSMGVDLHCDKYPAFHLSPASLGCPVLPGNLPV
jgi:hypothetical protein